MAPLTTAAVAGAFVLDLVVGEPPRRFHPVAVYGGLVGRVGAARIPAPTRSAVIALGLPLAASGIAYGLAAAAFRVDGAAGAAIAAIALFVTTSLRMLIEEALSVIDLSATDLPAARSSLPALAGRDPDHLSPGELRSAALESTAENLADGLVGPMLAFVLGAAASLPLAVAAAVWVKAVNTGDSMIGYRSKPYGRAAARLDDLVMWVPARLTAGLLAAAGARPAALLGARRWAGNPSSPNSGWPMATLAALLGVQLRKPGAYTLNPEAALPTVSDAKRGVTFAVVAGLLSYVIAGVVSWF